MFAPSLAGILKEYGFRIWYDEFELEIGDSLRESIDKGLVTSRYGIVVLSPKFLDKNWTKYELKEGANKSPNIKMRLCKHLNLIN
ncbi:toll/interleukin-1 receptor domain-containing protein [Aeromonas caviae]|uniref:toll/interleukin-1 receptor domain-containing protein n=1 Tax=Aeromonas caviae TaxID=648 RepID=UPI0038D13CE2